MQRLLFIALLLAKLSVSAQSFTGSWLGTYYRDLPGNKRLFFYRFHLLHQGDSLVGICEALEAQTDLRSTDPAQSAVVAKYRVYNRSAPRGTAIRLHTGRSLTQVSNLGASLLPPVFLEFVGRIVSPEADPRSNRPLMQSLGFADDGSVGRLEFRQLSADPPDLSELELEDLGKLSLPRVRINWPVRKKKEPVVEPAKAKDLTIRPWNERKSEQQAQFTTDRATALIRLYDNGEIDNDTVSLYLNGKPILGPLRLSGTALETNVALAEGRNEFTLVAHNLGDIAPNTALAVITVGDQRYEVHLRSDLQTNAVILLHRGPSP